MVTSRLTGKVYEFFDWNLVKAIDPTKATVETARTYLERINAEIAGNRAKRAK